ncbi:MAG: recombinase RecA [Deltaproteobacteria bacterium]|nr:recombinase RecA [Deltaproteobacteria bacterium]
MVERLREQIRRMQAAPRRTLGRVGTGIGPLDAVLPDGGFWLGQTVELQGEAATGRASVALRVVAEAMEAQRLCAWVDGPKELYAPSAQALGVDLQRLLVVQPRAPGQLAWAAVQLLRSGAFAVVVLDLTHTGVRLSPVDARRLQEAAGQGGALLLLLSSRECPAEGALRLELEPWGLGGVRLEVARSRRGGAGSAVALGWEVIHAAPPPAAPSSVQPPPEEVAPPSAPRLHPLAPVPPRDGPVLRASRPGRDVRLPSLSSVRGGRAGRG